MRIEESRRRLSLKRLGEDEGCWKWLGVVRRGFESYVKLVEAWQG